MNSVCVLYYSYGDTKLLMRLIDEGDGTNEQKEHNRANLRRVVQFCMNETDCRRTQVLQYFGEQFPKEQCHKTCDNCMSPKNVEMKDVTELATDAVRLVSSIERDKGITMLYAIDVFRGSKLSKVKLLPSWLFHCQTSADETQHSVRSFLLVTINSNTQGKDQTSTEVIANDSSNSSSPNKSSVNDTNVTVSDSPMPTSSSVLALNAFSVDESNSRWGSSARRKARRVKRRSRNKSTNLTITMSTKESTSMNFTTNKLESTRTIPMEYGTIMEGESFVRNQSKLLGTTTLCKPSSLPLLHSRMVRSRPRPIQALYSLSFSNFVILYVIPVISFSTSD